jgi:hypothetical protein
MKLDKTIGDAEKRASIKRYFESTPVWLTLMYVVGVLALASPPLGIAILITAKLISRYRAKHFPVPSDHQLDGWLNEDKNNCIDRAFQKTAIEESSLKRPPLVVLGIPESFICAFHENGGKGNFFPSEVAGHNILHKVGNDKMFRTSAVQMLIVFITENQLIGYRTLLDLITGNPMAEATQEFFLKDIVSVETQTESMSFSSPDKKETIQVNSTEVFKIHSSGATQIRIALDDPTIITKLKASGFYPSDSEIAVSTIRSVVREKKAA